MENIYPSRQLSKVFLYIALIIFFIPGCKPGEQNDEMALLIEKQTFITAQRDSLLRLLDLKNYQIDTVYARINSLKEENKTLAEKNKSLQIALNRKGEQAKKVTAENDAISKALSEKSIENDSLRNVIAVMQQKIIVTDSQKIEVEKSNAILAQSVQQKDMKIAADSIAIANKPKPPKESGFVSITEIGGGLGLGDVSVDYSNRMITVNTIAGYRVNNHFIAGIGTGVNIYNGGFMIPAYLDFRYAFNKGKVSPFFVADGGVLFHPDGLSSSGLFINPAFGVTKQLNSRTSFHISGGVWVQEAPQGMRNSFFNIKGGVSFMGK